MADYLVLHYGAPTNTYLEFVNTYILQVFNAADWFDPFSLALPPTFYDETLVARPEVEREISLPHSKIVLGRCGSGKSTQFYKLTQASQLRALTVCLAMNEIGEFEPEHKLRTGAVSLLTARILTRLIFNAYWEDLFLNEIRRKTHLARFQKDKNWEGRFFWFYANFPPLQLRVVDDADLMAWLDQGKNQPPYYHKLPERDALRAALSLALWAPSPTDARGESSPGRPLFDRVQILVDGIDDLSDRAVMRLFQDTQRLIDLRLAPVIFKLFIEPAWENRVTALDCVRKGQIGLYRLPDWEENGLKQLLRQRIFGLQPGEYAGIGENFASGSLAVIDRDWVYRIPDQHINLEARAVFMEKIVTNALKAADPQKSSMDAPIHALKLARAFLGLCARRLVDKELPAVAPLDLEEQAITYLDEEKE